MPNIATFTVTVPAGTFIEHVYINGETLERVTSEPLDVDVVIREQDLAKLARNAVQNPSRRAQAGPARARLTCGIPYAVRPCVTRQHPAPQVKR